MNRDDEKVIIGSLQRIAAALEAIAKQTAPQTPQKMLVIDKDPTEAQVEAIKAAIRG